MVWDARSGHAARLLKVLIGNFKSARQTSTRETILARFCQQNERDILCLRSDSSELWMSGESQRDSAPQRTYAWMPKLRHAPLCAQVYRFLVQLEINVFVYLMLLYVIAWRHSLSQEDGSRLVAVCFHELLGRGSCGDLSLCGA